MENRKFFVRDFGFFVNEMNNANTLKLWKKKTKVEKSN